MLNFGMALVMWGQIQNLVVSKIFGTKSCVAIYIFNRLGV